ncbi:MAG: hypothetical protein H6672_05780 [Anaerolineaceae bacterium]|nr:hypothetical protein [Anaerolineaceae bacterium]
MLFWKLWRAIDTAPPRHPLFHYVPSPARRKRAYRVALLALVGCPAAYGMALYWPSVYPVLFAAGVPPTLYVVILTSVTAYLLTIAAGIGLRIATSRERGVYDLLAAAPDGGFTAVWDISMNGLHSSATFRWFRLGLSLVAFTLIVGLGAEILLPLVAMARSGTTAFYPVLLDVATWWLLAVAFYLDTAQSLTLASLLGMVGPFYVVSVPGAALWSAGVFLLTQTGVYLAALLGGSILFQAAEPLALPVQIGAMAWAIAVLLGLRQLVNQFAWRALQRQTAAGPDDLRRWSRVHQP